MTERIYLRSVQESDTEEFVALMQCSRALHEPWITPPTTRRMFARYLERTQQPDHGGMLLCRNEDDVIVGVINLNNIVRGSFLSASLGYYVGQPYAGRGYMAEGLNLTVHHAFARLGLHRLEANIQPDNRRSIELVKRCGFSREGSSPSFLFINGRWRDHERWAIVDNRAGLMT